MARPQRASSPLTAEDLKQYIDKKFEESIAQLLSEIRSEFSNKNSETKDLFTELKKSVDYMSDNYDELLENLKSKTKMLNDLQTENTALRGQVIDLNTRLDLIEQQSRKGNIEIQCVPEYKSENLETVVQQPANTVACNLTDQEILNYHRISKMNQDSTRLRSIVLKLSSPLVRDKILAAVKIFNKTQQNDKLKLNSSHLGLAGEKKSIFVCEHLSLANKKLHAAARAIAKERKYEFVWVWNGRINMKKDINSKAFQVKNSEQ